METVGTGNDNSEYVYSEEPRIDAYPLKSPSKVSLLLDKLKQQKKLFVIIGVVLVIYIVFKVMSIANHKRTESEAVAPALHPLTPTVVSKPINQTNNNLMSTQPEIKPLSVAQQQVQQSSDNNGSGPSWQDVQTSINNMNQQMYNMQQELANLQQVIRQMNYSLQQEIMQRQRIEMQRMSIIRNRAQQTYHVQAVIPNRAWLSGPRNSTLTVIVGTVIPGVGRVIEIDAEQGNVVTENGVTLHYSLQDS